METETSPTLPNAYPACPFAKVSESSQVIRRQDLLDLGTSFRDSLLPLKDLVGYMRRQVSSVDRLQRWVVALAMLASLGTALHFVALTTLNGTAREMRATVDKIDQLESRMNSIGVSVVRAAVAAEEARRGTQSIASAQASIANTQASAPTIELIAEPDPVKARTAPVILRVTARPSALPAKPLESASAAVKPSAAPSSFSLPLGTP